MSDNRTFTTRPGNVSVPKYPNVPSLTAEPSLSSPLLRVTASTRVMSDNRTFTTRPGNV